MTYNLSKDYDINRFSKAIETWLMKDERGKWYKHEDNPNCFTDKRLGRVLYVYEDSVKYWEDIRCNSAFVEYPIPNCRESLLEIIS